MDVHKVKTEKRERRHKRIRAKVIGTMSRPRLAVYKSNRGVYGQIIDDEKGTTLASVQTDTSTKKPLKERAFDAGKSIATAGKTKSITHVVFDRGGFVYTGSVKAFADGAREGGLIF